MLNKLNILLIFIALFTFSCKKATIDFDREKDMITDTVSLQIGLSILSSTTNQLDFEIEMVTFNDLVSESNYNDSSFKVLPNQNPDIYTPTFGSFSNFTPTPHTEYSTIFLFEIDRKDFYHNHNFGVYLRRYLEQNSADNNIAFAFYKPNQINSLHFNTTENSSYFKNDWLSNINSFYAETNYYSNQGSNNLFSSLITHVNTLIDSLVLHQNILPNKSITLCFSSNYFYEQSDSLPLVNLINKANLNQVSINYISLRADYIKQLAFKTGGFVVEIDEFDYFGNQTQALNSNKNTNTAYFLQNIHNLLSKNYTSHKAILSIYSTNGFYPNSYFNQNFGYNGISYYLETITP